MPAVVFIVRVALAPGVMVLDEKFTIRSLPGGEIDVARMTVSEKFPSG